MFIPLTYAEDIIHALKVGVFLSFTILFMTLVMLVVKAIRDENQNNL
jgi:uncharacterized membrane protein